VNAASTRALTALAFCLSAGLGSAEAVKDVSSCAVGLQSNSSLPSQCLDLGISKLPLSEDEELSVVSTLLRIVSLSSGWTCSIFVGIAALLWVIQALHVAWVCIKSSVRRGTILSPQRLTEGIWTIHQRRYDLSEFADRHPGGALAIDLGRNRDCTVLFESYHALTSRARLQAVLKKYELPESKESLGDAQEQTTRALDHTSEFSDPFHEAVREFARRHFKQGSAKMKLGMGVFMASLCVAQLVLMGLMLAGYQVAALVLPFVSGLLAFNLAHDGSHFAASSRPIVNRLAAASAPFFWNSAAWMAQHVVQHHCFTNEEGDVDMLHFLPWARASRLTSSKNLRLKLPIWLFVPIVFLFANFKMMLYAPANLLFVGTVYSELDNVEDFAAGVRVSMITELGGFLAFCGACVHLHGFLGLCWVVTALSLSSCIFIIATQGAHLCESSMEATPISKGWARHQVESSMNFRPSSTVWAVLTGGLNMQSLHHVLPGVSASHYTDMWPEFEVLCKEHGVRLSQVDGIAPFFQGFVDWMSTLYSEEEAF